MRSYVQKRKQGGLLKGHLGTKRHGRQLYWRDGRPDLQALLHAISRYGFGWESQLLELGFLSIWACPWIRLYPRLSSRPLKLEVEASAPGSAQARAEAGIDAPPSLLVVAWANRWLLFRIMLGAGLIKVRGDECWRNLTCMHYHYQVRSHPSEIDNANTIPQ